MPEIPINVEDYPTSPTPLDEALSYTTVIRELRISGPDRNNNDFLSVRLEVVQPIEWAGRNIMDNYICIPPKITPQMSLAERRKAEDQGVRLRRFVECFKVPTKPLSTEKALGLTGVVTAKNEEWPEGSGNLRPKVADYYV